MSLDLREGVDGFVDDDDGGGRVLDGRAWTALGAAVVLGVIILLALWFALSGDDEPRAEAKPPAAVTPPGAPTPAGGRCPKLPSSNEIPTAAPQAEWRIVYTVALPFSPTAGPAVVDGDVARCFARSPEGALFAAVQIGMRGLAARDGERVTQEQTVPGDGQEAFLAALRQRGWSPPQPGDLCQIAGFSFVSYSPERAVVSLASRCGDTLQLTQSTVVWSGHDWKQELQPDGSSSPTAHALASLEGLVVWGGV